jgi:hypothetical protein
MADLTTFSARLIFFWHPEQVMYTFSDPVLVICPQSAPEQLSHWQWA